MNGHKKKEEEEGVNSAWFQLGSGSEDGWFYELTRDCGPAGWSHETAVGRLPLAPWPVSWTELLATTSTHLLYCTSYSCLASSLQPGQARKARLAPQNSPGQVTPDHPLPLPPSLSLYLLHSPAINNMFSPQFGKIAEQFIDFFWIPIGSQPVGYPAENMVGQSLCLKSRPGKAFFV